jgi:hypothetical protein
MQLPERIRARVLGARARAPQARRDGARPAARPAAARLALATAPQPLASPLAGARGALPLARRLADARRPQRPALACADKTRFTYAHLAERWVADPRREERVGLIAARAALGGRALGGVFEAAGAGEVLFVARR